MIVLLNGAFGVGKTTVAKLVVSRLPSSRLFDPERIGFVLQRLPRWIPVEGRGRGDFQHMQAWRRFTVRGIGIAHWPSRPVVVPMAFTERAYLDEVRRGIAVFDPDVRHVCLVAPLEVVRSRLAARGEPLGSPGSEWVHRRAQECCAVHGGADFADQIATQDRTAEQVADAVLAHLVGRG